MHFHLSLLLIFTAFTANFLTPVSTSILQSSSPPSSALATIGATPTSLDPQTNALLPRAPEQQVGTPSARCRCRDGPLSLYWLCYIYQILNWPTDQNIIVKLHDELIKCGKHFFGLQRYYIPERESGLGAFAYFRLQYGRSKRCWTRGIASALGTTGVVCSREHVAVYDLPTWHDQGKSVQPQWDYL